MKGNRFLIAALLGSVVLSGMSFQAQASQSWSGWVTTIVNKLSKERQEALLKGLAAALGFVIVKQGLGAMADAQEIAYRSSLGDTIDKIWLDYKECKAGVSTRKDVKFTEQETTAIQEVSPTEYILQRLNKTQKTATGCWEKQERYFFGSYGDEDVDRIFDACRALNKLSVDGTLEEYTLGINQGGNVIPLWYATEKGDDFPNITKEEVRQYRTLILGDKQGETYLYKDFSPDLFATTGFESRPIIPEFPKVMKAKSLSYFSTFKAELAIKAKNLSEYTIRGLSMFQRWNPFLTRKGRSSTGTGE